MSKKKLLKIAITTGDQDGVGPEVSAKALFKIGVQKNVQFILWRSSSFSKKFLQLIDKKFKRQTFSSVEEALSAPTSTSTLVDICSSESAPTWVEQSAYAAFNKRIDALVTAPLSKTLIRDSGFKDLGHTDILRRVTRSSDLFMTFLGANFHVILMTGHVPLKDVSSKITPSLILKSLAAGRHVSRALSKKRTSQIALVGLNPHAGEDGLIGTEEVIFKEAIAKFKFADCSAHGPLVPDAVFREYKTSKYDLYVTPYHDQGLIPFKLVHQYKSCHLTLGLPFIRTSVDHGTAKDIAGKNKADFSSMQQALLRAILLSQNSFKPNQY